MELGRGRLIASDKCFLPGRGTCKGYIWILVWGQAGRLGSPMQHCSRLPLFEFRGKQGLILHLLVRNHSGLADALGATMG